MTSPVRRIQTLRASEIHADATTRVIAIEAVHCQAEKSGPLYRLVARIEPTAMVICESGNHRVFNLAPVNTSLESLKRDVPGLEAMLG